MTLLVLLLLLTGLLVLRGERRRGRMTSPSESSLEFEEEERHPALLLNPEAAAPNRLGLPATP